MCALIILMGSIGDDARVRGPCKDSKEVSQTAASAMLGVVTILIGFDHGYPDPESVVWWGGEPPLCIP